MLRSKTFVAAALAAFLSLPLVACEEEGPAERAGRALDDAAEDLRGLVEDEGPLEKAGRKADEAIEKAKESLEGE